MSSDNSKYSYKTKGNGFTIEIFRNEESIFFAQDESASEILSQLEETKTDEIEQYTLSQYDL